MKRILGLVGPFLFCCIVFAQLFSATAIEPATEAENQEWTRSQSATSLHFPVKGHTSENIISFYGDPRGKSRKHLGVDIKADRHTPVLAIADGTIEAIREGGNGGKTLYLRSADGTLYFYAHLEDWLVKEDATVDAGEEIATVGNSGNASRTTPHLHFEIMHGKERTSIDPLPILLEIEE